MGTEMSIEFPAYESGLDRFLHPDKGDFLGKAALVAKRDAGLSNTMVTLKISGHPDADPLGSNPLYINDQLVGRTTSGNYGFRIESSLAMALVNSEHAQPGTEMKIEVLGTMCDAQVVPASPYDTDNSRLRA
jgi:dimethylglycine dehydrogenase